MGSCRRPSRWPSSQKRSMVGYWGMVLGFVLAVTTIAAGFKYQIEDRYTDTSKWSFTETYMYGSGKGPLPWKNGDSNIKLDFNVDVLSVYPTGEPLNLSVLFYHDMHSDLFVPEGDLCSFEYPPDTSDLKLETFVGQKDGEKWKMVVKSAYKVVTSGVQNVLFQVCPNVMPTEEVDLKGTITFENPYGYLPGRFYGYLPFEGARFFAFLFFDIYFLAAVLKFRHDLLPLHYAILGVLVVASLEALAWFLAFNIMNDTGVPYCCPFPSSVIFAMICELFQKTFSRALLLVICLGYGIARPRLHKGEWVSLVILSVLYLGASIMDEASEIAEATTIKNDNPPTDRVWWSFPALLCDIVFLSWIYMSLVTIMKVLKEQNENYKLEMYNKLSSTIILFVTLFGILTIVVLLSRVGLIQWPWNLMWAETVSWEVLNFAVLAAICAIWRPSPTSKFLSQAKQLPTSEFEGGDDGIEFSVSSSFSIVDDDDPDDDHHARLS